MPPLAASRQFEIISAVLALAEERGFIPLAEAATIVDVPTEQLRTILNPVLHLEYLDADGEPVDQSRAFELGEDDVLEVHTHWLRDLDASPPSGGAALRLYIAATVYQATATKPSIALDQALVKLRQLVAIDMVVPTNRPEALDVAERAYRLHRSLKIRYLSWKDDTAIDREVLPWDIYGQWGHWYVYGPEAGDELAKNWRVDRMATATIGDLTLEPPAEIPEHGWFDFSERLRRVVVRVPATRLAALPQPHTLVSQVAEADGRVRAEIEVAGDGQLDHLLVALGPEGEVIEPVEYRQRRTDRAAVLLAHLDAT